MYCKLKYIVIYLKLLTNFVILRSFGNLIDEDFIKIMTMTEIKGIFLKLILNIPKIYLICIMIYHFYHKGKKKKKCNNLVCDIDDKENYVVHIRDLKQALNHRLILKKYIDSLIKKHG